MVLCHSGTCRDYSDEPSGRLPCNHMGLPHRATPGEIFRPEHRVSWFTLTKTSLLASASCLMHALAHLEQHLECCHALGGSATKKSCWRAPCQRAPQRCPSDHARPAAHLIGVEDAVVSDVGEGAVARRQDALEEAAAVCQLLHPDVHRKGARPAPLHALNCQAGSCNDVASPSQALDI